MITKLIEIIGQCLVWKYDIQAYQDHSYVNM